MDKLEKFKWEVFGATSAYLERLSQIVGEMMKEMANLDMAGYWGFRQIYEKVENIRHTLAGELYDLALIPVSRA